MLCGQLRQLVYLIVNDVPHVSCVRFLFEYCETFIGLANIVVSRYHLNVNKNILRTACMNKTIREKEILRLPEFCGGFPTDENGLSHTLILLRNIEPVISFFKERVKHSISEQ